MSSSPAMWKRRSAPEGRSRSRFFVTYGEMNVEDGRIPHSEQKKKFACVPPSFCIRLARDLLGGGTGGGTLRISSAPLFCCYAAGENKEGGKEKNGKLFPPPRPQPSQHPPSLPLDGFPGRATSSLSLSPNFLPCLSNARRASASVCPEPRSSGGGEAKQHA